MPQNLFQCHVIQYYVTEPTSMPHNKITLCHRTYFNATWYNILSHNLFLCHINTIYTTPHNVIQCQKIRYYNIPQRVSFYGKTQRIIILCLMILAGRGVLSLLITARLTCLTQSFAWNLIYRDWCGLRVVNNVRKNYYLDLCPIDNLKNLLCHFILF